MESKDHLILFIFLWLVGDIGSTWLAFNTTKANIIYDTSILINHPTAFVVFHIIIAICAVVLYKYCKDEEDSRKLFNLVVYGYNILLIFVVCSNLSILGADMLTRSTPIALAFMLIPIYAYFIMARGGEK